MSHMSSASRTSGHGGAGSGNQTIRGLSREVLRWLQSLDLAYSVRNVSRDFATGFLVAEILSRYDSSIHMHSYDNGCNIVKRKDNWRSLCKFFNRADIPYTDDEIGRIIHYEKAATVNFVNRLYTLLTQRRVKPPPTRKNVVPPPAFAKDTASLALKQRLRDPEMSEVLDLKTQEAELRKRLQEHEDGLRQERKDDPERFMPKRSQGGIGAPESPSRQQSKILRGPQRKVGAEQKTATISVKQVQVKHIDRNVANLRATKDMHARDITGAVGGSMSLVGGEGSLGAVDGSRFDGVAGDGSGGGSLPGIAATAILNEVITASVEGTEIANDILGDNQDPASAFESMLMNVPDDISTRVLSEIRRRRKDFAPRCIANPRDFWRVCSLLCTCMETFSTGSPAFEAASDCFRSWAMALRMRSQALDQKHGNSNNQSALQQYFSDFALSHILELIKISPDKRRELLRIAYSFTVPSVTAHKTLIRLVQQRLGDQRTFLHCLVGFATLEEDLLLHEELMDLYMYYTTIALGMPSPTLRAAAISVLVLLVPQNPEQGVELLKGIRELAAPGSGTWWEVRVQVVVLAATLLSILPADDEANISVPLEVIMEHFTTDAPLAVRKAGLSYAASALRMHPQLARRFVDVLMSLPEADMADMLKISSGPEVGRIVLPSSRANGGSGVPIHALPLHWHHVGIANALAQRFLEQEAPRVEREDALVLLAALDAAGRPDIGEEGKLQERVGIDPEGPDAESWRDVFLKLRDYILVALADPVVSELAAPILGYFLLECQLGGELFSGEGSHAFLGMLDILFPTEEEHGDRSSQERLCEMLADAVGIGPGLGSSIVTILQDFKAMRPILFEGDSSIAVLLRNLV